MNISELKKSTFLKKEDCGRGILVTIRSVERVNVAQEGAPEELKWSISFDEVEKPMVLNSTNGQIIAAICDNDESDNWTGHKIVLYHDPNIAFGGKLVGGIRARAPKTQPKPAPVTADVPTQKPKPAPAPAPAPVPAEPEADDVPF